MTPWKSIQSAVAGAAEAFLRSLRNPLDAQQRQLKTLLAANSATWFGSRYRFSRLRNIEDYQSAVPLHDYADLAPGIERTAAGELNVLCATRPCLFEETAGSTRVPKLIPYTAAGLAAYRRALRPWLDDLLRARPAISQGPSYWSISPVSRQPRVTSGGFSVGMTNDADYFGRGLSVPLCAVLAVPPQVARVQDIRDWQYLTLRFLLEAQNLALISVWSPTFVLELLSVLMERRDELCADIATGVVCGSPTALLPNSASIFSPRPERAALIRDAVTHDAVDTRRLWPRLDTLSAWTHASSARFSSELRARFPDVYLQGKGLLATEGVVSVPLCEAKAPVLAVNSGFYEFLDADGRAHVCTDINEGQIYQLVLTTASGLYRYRLGDRVLVRGWHEATPMLEFVGRMGLVSDLCGEKLSEAFVLAHVPQERGFAMLAPSLTPAPHYRLFVDAEHWSSSEACRAAKKLDQSLQANPQYRYARRLGQLARLRPQLVRAPWKQYRDHLLRQGQLLGDIKPTVLSADPEWTSRFEAGAEASG